MKEPAFTEHLLFFLNLIHCIPLNFPTIQGEEDILFSFYYREKTWVDG